MKPRNPSTVRALLAGALLAGWAPLLAAGDVASLAGDWRPDDMAAAQQVRTTVSGQLIGGHEWLRLTTRELDGAGRGRVESLMLRQAPDGTVSAYLFTDGGGEARRLTGAWSADGELVLTAAGGVEHWRWSFVADCDATLVRRLAGDEGDRGAVTSRLTRASCAEGRIAAASPDSPAAAAPTDADGRPPDSRPSAPPARPPADATSPAEAAQRARQDEPAAETGVAAPGSTEVDVGDLPVARAPAPAAVDGPATVIIAGRGKPLDEVQKAVALLREFLEERGVETQGPSDEIVVLQAAEASLAYLVREVRDRGAASLLYVEAAFGGRERIIVECYDGNGLMLWSEKVVGGTGMRQFKWMNPKLVARMKERLEARIGGTGLPAGGTD